MGFETEMLSLALPSALVHVHLHAHVLSGWGWGPQSVSRMLTSAESSPSSWCVAGRGV